MPFSWEILWTSLSAQRFSVKLFKAMGNAIGTQRVEDLRTYLMDSPDLVVHSLLASYKLFKVFHCAHEGFKHGGVIVKLFIPNVPEEDEFQESVIRVESVLKPYRDAAFLIQCRFRCSIHPNAVPYESAEILGKSATLMRQYFGRNLFDRLYSYPRLTCEHKIWFAIQILAGLAQTHSVGVIHGDVKCENVFIIGSFQAVLTDFSTFIKPVYLPLDDPVAATSLFFESGVKRRRCFIAPERFIDSLTSRVLDEHGRRMTFFDKEFTSDFVKMDIFACGLCLAELFLDGQHIMDLPELLAYRNGAFDLGSVLDRIPEPYVRILVKRMTERDPEARPDSAVECLRELFSGSDYLFSMFALMTVSSHPVYANADMRIMLIRENWGGDDEKIQEFEPITELEIFQHCSQSSLLSRGVSGSMQPLLSWSDGAARCLFPHPNLGTDACRGFCEKLMVLWTEGATVHQTSSGDVWRASSSLAERINEVYAELFNEQHESGIEKSQQKGPLLASFLGSAVLACTFSKSKLVYIDLITQIEASDSVIADLMIPYMHELVVSPWENDTVKKSACDCLLNLVKRLGNTETGLFSEYLFPLCLGLDEPMAVSLAGGLAGEAIRLSQPDKEGKKVKAISMFVERIIMHAWAKQWFSTLAEEIDVFKYLVKEDVFRDKLAELIFRAPMEISNSILSLLPLIRRSSSLIKTTVTSMFEVIFHAGSSIEIIVNLIHALSAIVDSLNVENKSFTVKAQVVSIASTAMPLLRHWSHAVRNSSLNFLISTCGNKLNLVDQFVFLRTSLPEGCSTLVDLLRVPPSPLSRSDYEQASLPTQKPDLPAPAFHSLSVPVLNAQFRSPRASQPDAPIKLSLRNFRDWKYKITNHPTEFPDLGCLSNTDGSLRSLYSPGSPQPNSNLQTRLLSRYPCVPQSSSCTFSPWKPESLLLATLNDFSASGRSVPVVSVDSTDDGRAIIAAGADCTIRVWRTNALETEAVIQPSKTIHIPACTFLACAKTIRNSKSFVLGNDSSFLVYRMDVSSDAVAAQSDPHTHGNLLAMDCFDTEFASSVLAVTNRGFVLDWDIRTNRLSSAFSLDPLRHSLPSGLVVSKDASTFVVSTISGNLVVFDNRYLKPVKLWTISSGVISKLAHSAEPDSIWASSASETCLFDVSRGGEPKQILSVNNTATVPQNLPCLADATQDVSFNDNVISRSIRNESAARCVLEFPGKKYREWNVLTGHNDGTVRHWTPSGQNSGISFPLQTDPPLTNVFGNVIAQTTFKDSELEESPAVAGRLCTVTEGHRDAVNHICVASLQYDIIVTAGRDGLIKLWK